MNAFHSKRNVLNDWKGFGLKIHKANCSCAVQGRTRKGMVDVVFNIKLCKYENV